MPERRAAGGEISGHTCPGSDADPVRHLRSGSCQRPSSQPHSIVSVMRSQKVTKVLALTELCGLSMSVETFVASKGPLQYMRCQRFGHTQRKCGHAPRCVACWGDHLSGDRPAHPVQPLCCICVGNRTVNYRVYVKWKETTAALAKQAPPLGQRTADTSQTAAPKSKRTGPSAE